MSAILYLPGLLVILFKRHGALGTLRHLGMVVLTQVILAQDFLRENPAAYLTRSFDISRVFLYKWTVNWRFLPEEIFLRRDWALALLIGHLTALIAFGALKWCAPDGGVYNVLRRGLTRPTRPAMLAPVTSDGERQFLSHLLTRSAVFQR
jgi:alpha-1,3-mannosyltransferase